MYGRDLSHQGPYCRAGVGKTNIISLQKVEGEERRCRAVRDFSAEQTNFNDLIAACPTLCQYNDQTGEWYLKSRVIV